MALSSAGAASSPRLNLLVLSLLVALGPMTVDLYLPTFPALQRDLSASTVAVQLTLTATTLGLALGQLAMGPWSDVIGRRWPLLIATAVHVLASIGVALAPSIGWVLVLRVLQGAGAAGGAVVTMAIVRDLYTGRSFMHALARLALVTGIAPVIAPAVGSQLLRWVDWRGIFVCVAAYGASILILAILVLRETLSTERRGAGDVRTVLLRYSTVLTDRAFVGVAFIGGMIVSGVFAYMTSSSFLLQQVYGLDANGYSLVFAFNAIAFVAGTQITARVAGRFSPRTILGVTLPTLAIAGLSVAGTSRLGLGLVALVICTVVFHLAAGASGPCLSMIGMAPHAARAGTAAALLGAVNFGLGGILSPVVGVLGVRSAEPVGLVMGAVGITAVFLFAVLVRPTHVEADTANS
ncbi:Bcr/CflA family efflux MFS transporter [Arthrobacter burdickii]|uniref:Bcr/CflA family efflux MFS transporter n=1 Tax=Arthrobacter burdickii TaxID=3035920 RepID=A0ABT8JY27_9MICC|nr:Bcr/CflA family efflux MFS transporter [Arthrobacter burdickii]MDN4609867.1 Bcr/CflA family efflux MFS transporter [Arthrobacter burdickii]